MTGSCRERGTVGTSVASQIHSSQNAFITSLMPGLVLGLA
jgi:hypothetical protein